MEAARGAGGGGEGETGGAGHLVCRRLQALRRLVEAQPCRAYEKPFSVFMSDFANAASAAPPFRRSAALHSGVFSFSCEGMSRKNTEQSPPPPAALRPRTKTVALHSGCTGSRQSAAARRASTHLRPCCAPGAGGAVQRVLHLAVFAVTLLSPQLPAGKPTPEVQRDAARAKRLQSVATDMT